ncbi:MAG: thermonuclease family protein [Bdellovibrionales bacterium]|nr:thermonuclease family protein [Bdellovibrionales bacterium]
MYILKTLLFTFTIYITLFSTLGFSNTSCEHTKTQFSCVKYLKNYDGDTITFKIHNVHPLIGENISVRVRGIDTPEIKTKDTCEKVKGRIARKLTENLMKNAKRIDLKNIGRDKYFRILADIEFDGKDLKSILIKNQIAYLYNGDTKKKVNWCERLPSSN